MNILDYFLSWFKSEEQTTETTPIVETETVIEDKPKRGRPKGSKNKPKTNPNSKVRTPQKTAKHKSMRTAKDHDWTLDDAKIVFYIGKFGVKLLNITSDDVAYKYISTTKASVQMMIQNIKYLIHVKNMIGEDEFLQHSKYNHLINSDVPGLSHFSANQKKAIIECDKLTENEFRMEVLRILAKITKQQQSKNQSAVLNRRLMHQNEKFSKNAYRYDKVNW